MERESKTFNFRSGACVMFKNEFAPAFGKKMPRLYVQIIDEYGYQRELTVQEGAKTKPKLYFECHVYQHPGRREISEVSERAGVSFIESFLNKIEKYPSLLFNETRPGMPKNHGFVHLCEKLHRGAQLSKTLI